MYFLVDLIWVLVAAASLELKAYHQKQSDFDYHWVGGVTNTTATIVVAVQPYSGNTLVDLFHYLKLYYDQGEEPFKR
jgi:hypothetical protein